MLFGTMMAYPQPLVTSCSCHVGPPRPPGGGPNPRPPKPNSMMTGTDPLALAGVVSVNWISTLIGGDDAVSTWPARFFVSTGTSPTACVSVAAPSPFPFGGAFGT